MNKKIEEFVRVQFKFEVDRIEFEKKILAWAKKNDSIIIDGACGQSVKDIIADFTTMEMPA